MFYYEVAPLKIIRQNCQVFTYESSFKLDIGRIVKIETGKKKQVGIILKIVKKPDFKTKPILEIPNYPKVPSQLIELAMWLSKYYGCHLSQSLSLMIPRGIDKKRRKEYKQSNTVKRQRTNILLNDEQQKVIKNIEKDPANTFLLHGATGSGKTEVYIRLAQESLKNGRSVIILTPEISLTPQLLAEFSKCFSDIIVTHSEMTESDRHLAWLEAATNKKPKIIIGPRSALFLPLDNIGLIVVDEAHEPSYKQEQIPKYSALRVATMLGRYHQATVIFGSATPNVIDYYLASQSKQPILQLTKPARQDSVQPNISIIDMKNRQNFKKHRFISDDLIDKIEASLRNKKQSLIFHNRRGSASITICSDCGWIAKCPNCFVPMNLHIDQSVLICHICNKRTNLASNCPDCQGANIIYKGIGTKMIEQELKKIFPKARINRFDADNSTQEKINNKYEELYSGEIDIIIGTQIIAKGLDLPRLQTVGIIQADTGLVLPDYNSNERAFQLVTQVIGRVGRNNNKSHVIIQTYQPENPIIKNSLSYNFDDFYKNTLAERQKGLFPPFCYILKLTCVYKREDMVIKNSQAMTNLLKKELAKDKTISIIGPTPSFYERRSDKYYWQILIKSSSRNKLIEILNTIPKNHWQAELDPGSLI